MSEEMTDYQEACMLLGVPYGDAGSFTEQPVVSITDKYASLRRILDMALEQASSGKGDERHANGRSFDEQPMQRITEMLGIGFPLGQAVKKSQEAKGMTDRGQHDAAIRELLGAINYLAGAVMALEIARRQGSE